jgi:hypothetical protein
LAGLLTLYPASVGRIRGRSPCRRVAWRCRCRRGCPQRACKRSAVDNAMHMWIKWQDRVEEGPCTEIGPLRTLHKNARSCTKNRRQSGIARKDRLAQLLPLAQPPASTVLLLDQLWQARQADGEGQGRGPLWVEKGGPQEVLIAILPSTAHADVGCGLSAVWAVTRRACLHRSAHSSPLGHSATPLGAGVEASIRAGRAGAIEGAACKEAPVYRISRPAYRYRTMQREATSEGGRMARDESHAPRPE